MVTETFAAAEQKWFYKENLDSECNVGRMKNHLENNKIPVLSCEKLGNRDDFRLIDFCSAVWTTSDEYDLIILSETFNQTDWSFLESLTNIDEAVKDFYIEIYNIFEACIPKSNKTSRKYPTWFNNDLINKLKYKEKLRKKYKETNIETISEFKKIRIELKKDIRNAHRNYLQMVENNMGVDSRPFWSCFH